VPSFCLSRPAILWTGLVLNSTRSEFHSVCKSDNFACEADNPHKSPLAKFTGHGTKNPGAAGIAVTIEDHDGIFIKSNVRSI
jgi:hypothetical protein